MASISAGQCSQNVVIRDRIELPAFRQVPGFTTVTARWLVAGVRLGGGHVPSLLDVAEVPDGQGDGPAQDDDMHRAGLS